MFYSNIHRYMLATALVLLVATGSAFGRGLSTEVSAQLPSYYPSSFQKTGVIRNASIVNQLTVDGARYALSSNARIHTVATEHASRFSLAPGLELGFTYDRDASGVRRITEIWILPAGSIKLN